MHRHGIEHLDIALAAGGGGLGQHRFASLHERQRRARHGHSRAIQHHDIAHRRADHRLFAGHVLQCLGRADVARGLVQCKRHQAHVPARQQVGQALIRLRAQPMDVGSLRQRARVDLHHRARHDHGPLGVLVGDGGHQFQVQPLVDDAEKAEPGSRQRVLQRGRCLGMLAVQIEIGGREMRDVHRAGEAMNVGVQPAARFIQRRPAGEHLRRFFQQCRFTLAQLPRCVLEGRQLVHAVVHQAGWCEALGQRQCHRCVQPGNIDKQAARAQCRVQQGLQQPELVVVETGCSHGRAGHQHGQARRNLAHFQVRRPLAVDGLFHIDHAPPPGQPRQQLLRPLEDKIPAQV